MTGNREAPGAEAHRSAVRSLLRLWPFVRPARGRMLAGVVMAVFASAMSLVIPLALKWTVDGPIADRDPPGVWLGGLAILVLGTLEAGLFGLRRLLVARPLAEVEASMRATLYRHLQRLPVAFHDRWASGQLLSRATTDLMLLRIFLAFALTFLVVNGLTIVIGFVILLLQRWTLGLVLLAPVIPLVILCRSFEARYSLAARTAQDQVGDLTTVVEESVLGIRIIKGFGRHRGQQRAFAALSGRVRATELHKARLLGALWAVIMILPEVAIGAALVLGVREVADGGLTAGALVAFLSTALALRWPVESIGFLLALSNEAATATDRYFEVLDVRVPDDASASEGVRVSRDAPASESAPAPADASPPDGASAAGDAPASEGASASEGVPVPGDVPVPPGSSPPRSTPVRGNAPLRVGAAEETAAGDGLRLEGVEFRYPDAPPDAPPVLRGVDLHIRPGETMALVGATGSGKTTLTALIPRLHEATAGRITLDGRDIATLPRARLRELVAVAFEEPTLFSASVGENVLMGGAAAGPAELERALAVAQADGFVHALPRGTATQVGEQGLSLSGGQRQRLALARAVIGDPRFLILDDPLSALDVHTEAQVERALREVLATTTALVVAHRPSTVLLADRVALLSEGRIAAVGTHHQLLRENREYAWLMSAPEGGREPHEDRQEGDDRP
ncbi:MULTISPECIES: ABC transporter ATP-binding protein [Streptomyces]|uniref:ABC transporter ATP-binding protein n=1 Tax=Streptomyces TaxID=1883 RepID=UPI00163C9D06|nr:MULTISPECIES: ABC transporter ATP-binding protein [Streptomyces]MBC2874520.1 ABC transporter ATP-binding protein [Streptomyces sp. TYQ1024]UBI36708.1 ABC transporter ATP-binding protein/permease [Streptomyces mobaraensis]UKW29300.1 ABC transporter ATP-binding protein/permease [Streptomyces sp. TYQ1024]